MLEHAAILAGGALALVLLILNARRFFPGSMVRPAGHDPHADAAGDLEPMNSREAQAWGYSGARCPYCSSLRLRYEMHGGLRCDTCDAECDERN